MTNQQIRYLAQLHEGQWFGFNGEVAYKNLWVAEGYTKPTLQEIDESIPQLELERWRQTFTTELYKLKIALENKGDLVALENIIASQPKQVQIAWNNTPTVLRNSPTVASLAIAMQYSDEVLDQLFKDANEVVL